MYMDAVNITINSQVHHIKCYKPLFNAGSGGARVGIAGALVGSEK